MKNYPTTPDGRYFVVNNKLWRCANPMLSDSQRSELVRQLMEARRAVRTAMREQDEHALRCARSAVNEAKIALGERGAVWWNDGAPDYNRKNVGFTPYASWYAELSEAKT
jgi:hypothetical protein